MGTFIVIFGKFEGWSKSLKKSWKLGILIVFDELFEYDELIVVIDDDECVAFDVLLVEDEVLPIDDNGGITPWWFKFKLGWGWGWDEIEEAIEGLDFL